MGGPERPDCHALLAVAFDDQALWLAVGAVAPAGVAEYVAAVLAAALVVVVVAAGDVDVPLVEAAAAAAAALLVVALAAGLG